MFFDGISCNGKAARGRRSTWWKMAIFVAIVSKKLLSKQFQQKMSIKANIWCYEANIDTTLRYDQQWIIINTHERNH